MAKRYARLNWQNTPSVATPMNATNLNKMDKGIDDCDNAIEEIYSKRVNNVVTTNEDTFLAGPVGKVLQDQVTELNKNFDDHRSFIFSRTDVSGLSAFPIDAGLYRVTIPNIPGLPSGINGYGCLVVFNCGDYRMLLYVDADFTLYSARADNANPVPTTWNKYTGATVQAQA